MRFSNTVRIAMAAVVATSLATACGSDDDEPAAEDTTETSETTTTSTTTPTAESTMVDVGGDAQLHLVCRGEGSPTILLEAGDEDDMGHWRDVAAELGAETRTCVYDRRGLGQSTEAEGCRGMDELIADIEALIENAQLEGPFVFVGASGGGYLMAEMATRHPDETAGLVLVETPMAITVSTLPPDVLAHLKCDSATNIENRDYVAVEHAVWDDRHEVGDFPMVIITNDYMGGGEGDEVTNLEDQKGWLVLSPSSEQVVVTSGHDVASNESELVIDKVLEVVEAARTS